MQFQHNGTGLFQAGVITSHVHADIAKEHVVPFIEFWFLSMMATIFYQFSHDFKSIINFIIK